MSLHFHSFQLQKTKNQKYFPSPQKISPSRIANVETKIPLHTIKICQTWLRHKNPRQSSKRLKRRNPFGKGTIFHRRSFSFDRSLRAKITLGHSPSAMAENSRTFSQRRSRAATDENRSPKARASIVRPDSARYCLMDDGCRHQVRSLRDSHYAHSKMYARRAAGAVKVAPVIA